MKRSEPRQQIRNQGLQVFESIGSCGKGYHRNRQGIEVLLKLQILVGGEKNVEMCRCTPKELAVLYSRPAHLGNGFDGMTG